MSPFPYDNARCLLPALMVSVVLLAMTAPGFAQADAMYRSGPRATVIVQRTGPIVMESLVVRQPLLHRAGPRDTISPRVAQRALSASKTAPSTQR